MCDNRGDDENSADGRILLTSIRAGRYTLTQTTAPTGYSTAADQSVRIAAGSVREVAVTNQAEPERTANLDVETTDGEGTRCLGPATRSCEATRRSKPATTMTTESPGSPVFHPAATSCARSSHQRVATPQRVHGHASRPRSVGDGDRRQRGAPGQPGAARPMMRVSFWRSLLRPPQWRPRRLLDLRQRCQRRQHQRRHHSAGDGRAGTYTLREIQPPTAISAPPTRKSPSPRTSGARSASSTPSAGTAAYWRFARLQARHRRPRAGRLLLCPCRRRRSGARAALRRGRRRRQRRSPDGRDRARGVHPARDPSALRRLPDRSRRPEIAEDQTVDVEVVNRLHPGRILIRKIDPNGVPLAGACFDLVEDGAGASCTDENGELLFAALVPGVYSVMETEAPRATSTRRQSTQSRSGLAARRRLTSSTSRHRRHRTAARFRSGNSSAP